MAKAIIGVWALSWVAWLVEPSLGAPVLMYGVGFVTGIAWQGYYDEKPISPRPRGF